MPRDVEHVDRVRSDTCTCPPDGNAALEATEFSVESTGVNEAAPEGVPAADVTDLVVVDVSWVTVSEFRVRVSAAEADSSFGGNSEVILRSQMEKKNEKM
eukprot:RCo048526